MESGNLSYKGYTAHYFGTTGSPGESTSLYIITAPGENLPANWEDQDPFELDFSNIVADTPQQAQERLMIHAEQQLFFSLIDWQDPALRTEYPDDYFLDGGHAIAYLCKGGIRTVKYRFQGKVKTYRFSMERTGRIVVEVRYRKEPPIYSVLKQNREYQLAFLKGQEVHYGLFPYPVE